uniref:Uncharacterized protein n=1 Tax=Anopheles farauti TaxID=69004 RepID=A0A182QSQ5_9DIPT
MHVLVLELQLQLRPVGKRTWRLSRFKCLGSIASKRMTVLYVCLFLLVSRGVADGRAIESSSSGNELMANGASEASSTVAAPVETTVEDEPSATTTTTTSTTTINPKHNEVEDDVPTFNRGQVSLDLPGDLFSSTANLTLRLRNFIAGIITRTSVRIAQVVRFFQPLFGYHLMIDIPKELDV